MRGVRMSRKGLFDDDLDRGFLSTDYTDFLQAICVICGWRSHYKAEAPQHAIEFFEVERFSEVSIAA